MGAEETRQLAAAIMFVPLAPLSIYLVSHGTPLGTPPTLRYCVYLATVALFVVALGAWF